MAPTWDTLLRCSQVLEVVAALKGMDIGVLAEQLYANTVRQFFVMTS